MIDIKLIKDRITLTELKEVAKQRFGDMVKAVVDIEKEVMAIGGEMHADEETVLLEEGSEQNNLWGINFYVDEQGEDFIEFDSMINIRPAQGNRSRDVEDKEIRNKVKEVVNSIIDYESNT